MICSSKSFVIFEDEIGSKPEESLDWGPSSYGDKEFLHIAILS